MQNPGSPLQGSEVVTVGAGSGVSSSFLQENSTKMADATNTVFIIFFLHENLFFL